MQIFAVFIHLVYFAHVVNMYEYMNMYVLYVCEHKGTHMHLEPIQDCRVSFSIILHLINLKQGVSVNQSL